VNVLLGSDSPAAFVRACLVEKRNAELEVPFSGEMSEHMCINSRKLIWPFPASTKWSRNPLITVADTRPTHLVTRSATGGPLHPERRGWDVRVGQACLASGASIVFLQDREPQASLLQDQPAVKDPLQQ